MTYLPSHLWTRAEAELNWVHMTYQHLGRERKMYLVIENTPGYMPDADEPAAFESYAEGVSYANELADELEERGYQCDRSWASSQNTYAIHCTTDEKMYDLGRNIEVVRAEGES